MDTKRNAGLTEPEVRVRMLKRRVENTRHDLDRYVGELDRRRQEAMDVRLQARRHPVAAAAIAAGAAGLLAGGTYAAFRAVKRARARNVRSIADRIADAVRALGPDAVRPARKVAKPTPAAMAARFATALAPALGAILAREAAAYLRGRLNGRSA